jgi:hypothetical protein
MKWGQLIYHLLLLSLPFALAAGALWIISQVKGGWEGLGYFFVLMWVAGAWGVAVLLYLAWVVSQTGLQGPGLAAAAVLLAATIGGAWWGYQNHREEAGCRAAHQFYERLATLPPAEHEAAIRAGERFVKTDALCTQEGVRTWFGRDPAPAGAQPPLTDAQRVPVLQMLFQHGLPPANGLLRDAVTWGDAHMVELLIAARLRASPAGPVFPVALAEPAIRRLEPGTSEPDEEQQRYRAIARLFATQPGFESLELPDALRKRLQAVGAK